MVSVISAQTLIGLINSASKVRIETDRGILKGQRKVNKCPDINKRLSLNSLAI